MRSVGARPTVSTMRAPGGRRGSSVIAAVPVHPLDEEDDEHPDDDDEGPFALDQAGRTAEGVVEEGEEVSQRRNGQHGKDELDDLAVVTRLALFEPAGEHG